MARSIVVVLAFLLLAMINLARSQTGNLCTGSISTFQYNLAGLQSATGGNDQTCLDNEGNTYYYRPCSALQNEQCVTNTDATPAACQKDTRKIPQYHDCGSTSQVQWSQRSAGADQGFKIQFSGGQDGRMLDVEFICDKNGGTGQLQAATPTEQPEHFYHLSWTTKYACPGGGDGDGKKGDGDDGPAISGGWIFIIILFSLLIIYFIAGVAYNKFRKDAHGVELIPNHEFWFALPGLVIAGNVYVYRKLRGLCGARYEEM